jgi:hypothetical protein
MACGRQPGGAKVWELGICPAAEQKKFTGINSGTGAGRICWQVSGTFCGGNAQGTFAEKKATCISCKFYGQVRKEEGPSFKLTA